MDSKNKFSISQQLHWVLIIAVVLATIGSFIKYYTLQDFEFFVEAPCDVTAVECYARDCSLGECPPNNLDQYRLFSIGAADCALCNDNSCSNLCVEGGGQCSEILCSSQSDIECTYK